MRMICEICNGDIEIYEAEKTIYVKTCRACIESSYKEGVREGFKLAGGDVDKLASVYK